jgi:hypothetical protein
MSLEQASFLAQIISTFAIIASLIFVGVGRFPDGTMKAARVLPSPTIILWMWTRPRSRRCPIPN